MGSDLDLMAEMARELAQKGALRIDVNCGCPSNTVTGRGAGSSLLKDPNILHEVARAVVRAVTIPVTIKMRSGYEDISLFDENILAAEESGVRYITLHPRTKVDGYGPPARWDLIARAKALLSIPLIGNGDILTVNDAVEMLRTTGCDGLMIGRGSIINPFIFHQIRAHYSQISYELKWEKLLGFLDTFMAETPKDLPARLRVNKLKQLLGFIFKSNPQLIEKRQLVLSSLHHDPETFLPFVLPLLKESWNSQAIG
jgi:tRNA-dihydrouridine synthase C